MCGLWPAAALATETLAVSPGGIPPSLIQGNHDALLDSTLRSGVDALTVADAEARPPHRRGSRSREGFDRDS